MPDNTAPAADRRGQDRHKCARGTSCSRPLAIGAGRLRVRVFDVAPRGVSLLVPRRFERGSLLNVRLPDPDGGAPLAVVMRVARVRPAPAPWWGLWLVGGVFTRPLAGDELQALLG